MRDDFAVRFFELRKERGLKQSEIGEILGVSRGAISFYENGDREPSAKFILRAAEYFCVSTDWLLGRENAVKSLDIPENGDYCGLYLFEKERRGKMEMAVCLLRESLGEIVNQLGEMAERLRDKS